MSDLRVPIARRRARNGLPCAVARHWLSSFLLGAVVSSALLYYSFLDRHGTFAKVQVKIYYLSQGDCDINFPSELKLTCNCREEI
uniref:Uncharacterized protein n=1 Tax=Timema poppense TaxID=170557 RepID=A0A7R9HAF9_TIMPO|nr:unnamed protein product [Timema poppensis]